MLKRHFTFLLLLILSIQLIAQRNTYVSQVWNPDNGDGTYTNPIIHADYSDPDICQVGDDFYMTASSFNAVPGLPILHSKDLVNWELINHAIPRFPDPYFDKPQHGNGVWAPSIRYHDGEFYIFWGDPDRGIYMVKTDDPSGEWTQPILVKKAYGNIDPSPLWDDDGKVYLVHGFAHSRAGIKSVLQVVELSPDADEVMDKGTVVFDGHKNHPTLEGPKFYKRNDYYYIFAPGGGVPTGWQTVLRSKNIYGPYEDKIVLAQGSTNINGPHQGGLVELGNGDSWFVHFQDKNAYGRVVHLQPVKWIDDWPVMGIDKDKDGKGEPVITRKKPKLKSTVNFNPAESDEFESETPGPQWQWQANFYPHWSSLAIAGYLRLNAIAQPQKVANLWGTPNLLLQKFPAPEFSATTLLDASNLKNGEHTGLVIMGLDYATLTITKKNEKYVLKQTACFDAPTNIPEDTNGQIVLDNGTVWLRSTVTDGGIVNFSYSMDGKSFNSLGKRFKAKEGKWIGAKVGLFSTRNKKTGIPGFALYDWFRIEK